jgi:hypothetical protein
MALAGSWVLLAVSSGFAASVAGLSETTLVTSATDPDLVNPWGVSFSASSPFWVSDNGTGKATLYNTTGVKQGLVVSMPAGSTAVTGQVFNGTASVRSAIQPIRLAMRYSMFRTSTASSMSRSRCAVALTMWREHAMAS